MGGKSPNAEKQLDNLLVIIGDQEEANTLPRFLNSGVKLAESQAQAANARPKVAQFSGAARSCTDGLFTGRRRKSNYLLQSHC